MISLLEECKQKNIQVLDIKLIVAHWSSISSKWQGGVWNEWFLYSLALQWKLDIRSKSLLVTYYIVPLIFFLLMGGIFTSVMPEMDSTLIQSMIVMSVSMGAFLGLPPSLIETYGSDIKKIYKANGCLFI